MITPYLRPKAIFVALFCAYALVGGTPASAVSLLTADASGSVGAGRDAGSPVKLITPGEGSVRVTYGAAASDNLSGVGLSASVLGSGQARYGALAGRASAEATSSPAGPHGVGGVVVLNLGFLDTVEVVSSILAPGTPVTLTFVMTLDAAAFHVANGLFTPTRFGAAARNEARISDIEAGVSPPTFPPHTLVNSVGTNITFTTFEFDTAIGHHLELDIDLFVAAGANVDPFIFEGQATSGGAEVIADNTAHFFYDPSGDVRLVSESGHDYAVQGPGPDPVSEPASVAVLGVGAAIILLATRRRAMGR